MFALMRRFLFMLPPERAHDLALGGLDLAERLRLTRLLPARITDERELMGLRFLMRWACRPGWIKMGII